MQNLCPLNFTGDVRLCHKETLNRSNTDFLKTLQFSCDGLSIISSTDSNNVLLYSINDCAVQNNLYYQAGAESNATLPNSENFYLKSTIPIGEAIYDVKWCLNTPSNYFITTSRDHPIHLWDASSGNINSTYIGINDLDELDTAISLSLNLTGNRIYAGSNRMLRFRAFSYYYYSYNIYYYIVVLFYL